MSWSVQERRVAKGDRRAIGRMLLDLHPRTLRNYEKAGLVIPSRKEKWRYYSADDIA